MILVSRQARTHGDERPLDRCVAPQGTCREYSPGRKRYFWMSPERGHYVLTSVGDQNGHRSRRRRQRRAPFRLTGSCSENTGKRVRRGALEHAPAGGGVARWARGRRTTPADPDDGRGLSVDEEERFRFLQNDANRALCLAAPPCEHVRGAGPHEFANRSPLGWSGQVWISGDRADTFQCHVQAPNRRSCDRQADLAESAAGFAAHAA